MRASSILPRGRVTSIFLALVLIGFRAADVRAAGAPEFGAGGSLGLANAVEHDFKINRFKDGDANLFVQYNLEDSVVLRATLGSLKAKGYYAGQTVGLSDGSSATAPDLKSRVDYGLVSVSYDFRESAWTSGLFAGVGAYRIRPERAAAVFAAFRDPRETVWGLHVGADADVRVWKSLSLVGRITFHLPQTEKRRKILTVGAGALYRF
jgi:hypothetical protein